MNVLVCAKRGGGMQAGFVLEEAESGRAESKWIEGDPQVPWTRFGVTIAERGSFRSRHFGA